MSRMAKYLSIETDKIIAVLHSLLQQTGTWTLGDRNAEDYAKVIKETIFNYGGLRAD